MVVGRLASSPVAVCMCLTAIALPTAQAR
jgi:hypothetical protein